MPAADKASPWGCQVLGNAECLLEILGLMHARLEISDWYSTGWLEGAHPSLGDGVQGLASKLMLSLSAIRASWAACLRMHLRNSIQKSLGMHCSFPKNFLLCTLRVFGVGHALSYKVVIVVVSVHLSCGQPLSMCQYIVCSLFMIKDMP